MISLDGPANVWSDEIATYDIQIENIGTIETTGTLELYTYTPASELIVFDKINIPEIVIGDSILLTIEANTIGLPEGTYSMCAKTNFEEYI